MGYLLMKNKKHINGVLYIALYVVIGLIIGYVLNNYVVVRAEVIGHSMEPTYYEGDKVFVSRLNNPSRGDIVIVKEDSKNVIKRIVALPGDTIEIKDSMLFVNNKLVEEPYLNSNVLEYSGGCAEEGIKLNENSYFILGDNRNVSKDSREIGPISKDMIVGVVIR